MTAHAGPGPSTLASSTSSPVIPASAKQLRVKRRVINLVNPADPDDFSNQSIASDNSLSTSTTEGPIKPKFNLVLESEMQMPTQTFSPMGTDKNGVKGILRPSGTPGSGNGVRFFPKNRFRIITPNQSLLNPPEPSEPTPTPPSPTSNSFLSQLLAVVPIMSPRRTAIPPPSPVEALERARMEVDESWEQPGMEGEISLVASSIGGDQWRDRSLVETEEEEEGEVEEGIGKEPWNGVPEIHSSPLGLPATLDSSISSVMPNVPGDVSNIMSMRMTASEMGSFSISDFQKSTAHITGDNSSDSWLTGREESGRSDFPREESVRSDFTREESMVSVTSDQNPTIRRPLPSLLSDEERAVLEPDTPTPINTLPTKPMESIFADMSAEQADLSWPLIRHRPSQGGDGDGDGDGDGEGEDAGFHSVLTDIVDIPISMPLISPMLKSMGDMTQFFDCTASSPLALSISPVSVPVLSYQGGSPLYNPAKGLFDAQSSLATSLGAELELYRNLAVKLQGEVSERDTVLSELNVRCLEGEATRARLEEQLRYNERLSISPTPMRRTHSADGEGLGDRTTVVESEKRDLEIRLEKALGDQAALLRQLDEAATERMEMQEWKEKLRQAEERERDALVGAKRGDDALQGRFEELEQNLGVTQAELVASRDEVHDLRRKLDDRNHVQEQLEQIQARAVDLEHELDEAYSRTTALENQLNEAHDLQSQLEEAQDQAHALKLQLDDSASKVLEQDKQLEEMTELREEDERELERIRGALEKYRGIKKLEQEARIRVEVLEREVAEERRVRVESERGYAEERTERSHLENDLRAVREELRITSAKLALVRDTRPSPGISNEVHRLRSESASKDLEIVNLQRRKAELKEDRDLLNIALDSKQQELELLKRKYGVRGVAGSTPLTASRLVDSVKTPAPAQAPGTHRRMTSKTFVTPKPVSTVEAGQRVKLNSDTMTLQKQRVMKRLEEGEERNGTATGRGSLRGVRMLA